MKDIELRLADQPGSLAAMASTLGEAGISVEGGGVFVADGIGIAHFLVADHHAATAADALRRADIEVVAVRDTVLARLRQDVPGQLGALCKRLADAGVNITTQYSDHQGQLILVVDKHAQAQPVLDTWTTRHEPPG